MRSKKVVTLIFAVGIMCSLIACNADKGEVSETTQATTASMVTETESETKSSETDKMNYITDWSIEEVFQSIELNGKTYSLPFTLEDLGEDYSVGEQREESYDLYYKDEYISLIDLDKNNEDINKCNIINFILDSSSEYKMGELYNGNSKKNVEAMYGKPSSDSGNVTSYNFKGNRGKECILVIYKNNKIKTVGILCYFEEEEE